MHLLKGNLLAMALLCLVIASCSKEDLVEQEALKYEIDLSIVQQNDSKVSGKILNLVNFYRDSLGLTPLHLDNAYASAFAVDHTQYMIDMEKINHDNFGYRSEAIKYHDNAKAVGENVAYGYDTPEKVVAAWLKSPGHRANIEGKYTHTGFGIMKGNKGHFYFTQLFYRK